MTAHSFSTILLPDLGPATGLAVLGFRSHAFGSSDCCCVRSGFGTAFGQEADSALADLLVFTRIMSFEGSRKIGLCAPGCARMTEDEVSIACALTAAQAWDEAALEDHLEGLLAGSPSVSLKDLVIRIADTFAGYGLAFEAPRPMRATFRATTPAFRLSENR